MTKQKNKIPSKGQGFIAALFAFSIWGVIPLYFNQVTFADPLFVMSVRAIWVCICLFIFFLIKKDFKKLFNCLKDRSELLRLFFLSIFIGINWVLYMWLITLGRFYDASLSYFISPLITVMLAYFISREKLTKVQVFAIIACVIGVFTITLDTGKLPLISLIVGGSFSLYGLYSKNSKTEPLQSLFMQSLIFLPICLMLFFIFLNLNLTEIKSPNLSQHFWLFLSGPLTIFPLLFFLIATSSKLRLSAIALMQYIAPGMQFIVSIFFEGKPRFLMLLGFIFIWIGLLTYSLTPLILEKIKERRKEFRQKP